jgi:hypothetical protein
VSSVEAENLVAAGAAPAEVDVADLLARQKESEQKIADLLAAQPKPEDPTEAHLQRLKNYVDQVVMAYPAQDFGELSAAIDDLEADPKSAAAIAEFRSAVADFGKVHGSFEGLSTLESAALVMAAEARAAARTKQT